MKVRKGFVSNSSSSSFVIGIDEPIRESHVIDKKLIDYFKIPGDSKLFFIVNDIIDFLSHPRDGPYDQGWFEEEWIAEKPVKDHKYWYEGRIYTDECEPIQLLLSGEVSIFINDDELYLLSDGML